MQDHAGEQAVGCLFQALLAAWNAGDAAKYAALFTEDAHYIAFDGEDQRGRAAIEANHRPLLERFLKGSRLAGELVAVRQLAPGVVLAHAVSSIIERGRSTPKPERLSSQTLVAVQQQDGAWRFVAFHNTRVRPISRGLPALAAWKLADMAWKRLAARRARDVRARVLFGPTA